MGKCVAISKKFTQRIVKTVIQIGPGPECRHQLPQRLPIEAHRSLLEPLKIQRVAVLNDEEQGMPKHSLGSLY